MKILFLASEVVPYSKTGGLADVAGALPAALARLGHEVLVATPRYATAKVPNNAAPAERTLTLRFPFGTEPAHLHVAQVSPNHRVLFIGNDRFFGRTGIYNDAHGDYGDNHLRFAFFSMASLSASLALGFDADIVHLNDWQTGLAAVALQRGYRGTPLEHARSVFTIHNLAYQGVFPKSAMDELGLPWDLFTTWGLEFYDQVSFMKAGLVFSDELTTVSRRYAEEICAPEAGWGLDGLLRARRPHLHGILNGVDVEEWNPAKDPHLPAKYDARDLRGKAVCKADLLRRFNLPADGDPPVFGVVSRLVSQKGFDIMLPALPSLLEHDVRFVLLGSGDPRVEHEFRALAAAYPEKVGVRMGYDVALSHVIEAGSDFFLMPSLYEPCGLNQMYSLLYGTVPIVRAVGGLDDSVTDLSERNGNGIKFGPFDPGALAHAMFRALELYQDRAALDEVRRRGMSMDLSWDRSAREYESLYASLLGVNELPAARKAK